MHLVFFLEERSAEIFLKGILPNILPDHIHTRFVVFEGKQDLEKRIPVHLRGWQQPDAKFVILRDQDSGNCQNIKEKLVRQCIDANKHHNTLVRIACRELESFYLGDLAAVAAAIGPKNLAAHQNKRKYRQPDYIMNPSLELKEIAPDYQKISGARKIGPLMAVNNNNCSHSFNTLITGIKRLAGSSP